MFLMSSVQSAFLYRASLVPISYSIITSFINTLFH